MKLWNIAWPGAKRNALTFSFDDGRRYDIRLVGILNKLGLKGTFNLNSSILPPAGSEVREDGHVKTDEVAQVYQGHEVATHGAQHVHLTRVNPTQRFNEIAEDRRALEALVGYPVTGHAYAFGSHNLEVARQLEAMGIVYARTTGEQPMYEVPEDWLRWAATCHHKKMAEHVDKLLEPSSRLRGLFYVWTHSYELVNCWDEFERLCARLAESGLFWHATNLEVHDYVQSWRRLAFSCDGTLVRNPTGVQLWVTPWRGGGEALEIAPGATVRLA